MIAWLWVIVRDLRIIAYQNGPDWVGYVSVSRTMPHSNQLAVGAHLKHGRIRISLQRFECWPK